MKYVLTQPGSPEDRAAKLYWCVYMSGNRWNNRPSHAMKFNTENEATAYGAARFPGQSFDVEPLK